MPEAGVLYRDIVNECQSFGASLVAVTKLQPIDKIRPLYDAGQRVFAENKVQEILLKKPQLPNDCKWHLIGHLQTNKVRSILPHIELIHSLDNLKLWEVLQNEATKQNTKCNCLLQVKVAQEESKFGWDIKLLTQLLKDKIHHQFPDVKIKGVMGMTSLTNDLTQIREELNEIATAFKILKTEHFSEDIEFNTLSMGMSSDYKLALQAGSTMVRIGSLLFS